MHTRREVLAGAAGAAALTVLQVAGPSAASARSGVAPASVVPWLDEPPPVPEPARGVVPRQLRWEELRSRITPNAQFLVFQHYGVPRLSASSWRLEVGGKVARPLELNLAALRAQPPRTVEYTMECSGNHGLPFFTGGVGNARWTGAQLRRLPRAARPLPGADEVVFWGADRGPVTISDNAGILAGGRTGVTEPGAAGGQDLTITERFARSMTLGGGARP